MSVKLIHGNCLDIIQTLQDNSIDSIVTDPPYGLSNQTVDDVSTCLKAWLSGEPFDHGKKGFMGHEWDGWVPGPELWKECHRVLN